MKTLSYIMLGLLLSIGASEVLGRGLGGGGGGGGFHGGGFAGGGFAGGGYHGGFAGGGYQGGFAGGVPAGASLNRTPSFGGMSGFNRPMPSRSPESFGVRPNAYRPSSGPRPGERPSAGDLGHFLHLPPETRPEPIGVQRPASHELISRGVNPEAAGKLRDQWNHLSPERQQEIQHRDDWAHDVRQHIHEHGYGPNWPRPDGHHPDGPRPDGHHPDWRHPDWRHPDWHHPVWPGPYAPWWHRHPWHYWWTCPTWVNVTGWIAGPWGPPVYYDYGGNVTVQNDTVYVNGTAAGTTSEYAQQAIDLAGTGSQALEAETQTESKEPSDTADDPWMPLGVFAVVHQEQDTPTMFLQLAVRKDGVIAGTYRNTATDTSEPVQGEVDRKTQRAAWSIGDNKDTVMEAGIYNLTHDVTQCLIHFGKDKSQTWLLVRLDKPKEDASDSPPEN